MARYVTAVKGTLRSVDVALTSGRVQACIHLRDAAVVPAVEAKLAALGCAVVARTMVDGTPMLVATGPRPASEAEWTAQFSAPDAPLIQHAEDKPFDAWKLRSFLGFGGQILQLISSVAKKRVDGRLMLFSGSNLAANTINLRYKAQQHDDPHQLRLLKQRINDRLTPHLGAGAALPDIEDQRALLRENADTHPLSKVDGFMQKYSVNIGELGLRYIGAIGMAMDKKNPLRAKSGIGSIVGKTVALASTVPDPYNPKPRSWLDTIREKFTFLTGGLVEAGAFSLLTYDAFANTAPKLRDGVLDTSRSLKIGGKFQRDWLSGVGAGMFVTGYLVRSWAKYGERQVDMDELYAHTSDAIAALPPERIPQAVADISADLAEHFKRPGELSFATIYRAISADLARSHHFVPANSAFIPKERLVTGRPATRVAAETVQQDVPELVRATAQNR